MDGSVIYAMIRNDLVKEHTVQFHAGFHEDFVFNLHKAINIIT